MKKIGLDKFRLISAILIIAIHVFPLVSINETADFIFTHVICRIGVPFFLMITGFFTLPKAIKEGKENLIKYTLKILKIYAICIILYLPVNIYAGQFKEIGITGILKMIFIDGTFYHLWYFPALILGIWITYFLIKYLKKQALWLVVTLLYIIGLFGDSYFGISEKFEVISSFYNIIFMISNYTRNGLFYAPIFLSLGYTFANKEKKEINRKKYTIFTIISLTLMIIEGLILNHFNLQKHDSMYIMLIPVMIGVFELVSSANRENNKMLRSISTVIYIIHPIMIIGIRGVAKVLKMESIMIENNLVQYILVIFASVIFSIIFEITKNYILKFKKS